MSNILIVLSGADHWTQADGTEAPTGYWAEEFVVPHEKFVEAGHDVDIATPEGRQTTLDSRSVDPDLVGEDATRFAGYLDSSSGILASPLKLSDVDVTNYDAVVIPGGHGPMEDLYRPSVDPVVFFRLQLAMLFEGLRSERELMRVATETSPLCLGCMGGPGLSFVSRPRRVSIVVRLPLPTMK